CQQQGNWPQLTF
nr:immunoglobulin light chain junction region [Macaca mulatta]